MTLLMNLSHQPGTAVRGIDEPRTGALEPYQVRGTRSHHVRDALRDAHDRTLRSLRKKPARTVMRVVAVGILALGFAMLLVQLRRRD